MNKILQAASLIREAKQKLDDAKTSNVFAVVVLVGGVVWGGVSYFDKDFTPDVKKDVCEELRQKLEETSSLADKVQVLKSISQLDCEK